MTDMQKLTFKQYIESKEQLLKAIENTPISIVEYEIKKYCSIALGESQDEKQLIGLKPKQKIVVEWRYLSIDNPVIDTIQLIGLNEVDSNEKYTTFWTNSKLTKWLARHAKQGEQYVS